MNFTEREAIAKLSTNDNGTPADTSDDFLNEALGGTLSAGDFNYDDWELNNEIDSYSDLEYEQYSFTLGGTYNFTEAFYTTVSGTYDIFESDEEFVYGDEDGKSYSGYLAFGYNF